MSDPTNKPQRTAEEQAILDTFRRLDGDAFVREWAELILAQAREFGELAPSSEEKL